MLLLVIGFNLPPGTTSNPIAISFHRQYPVRLLNRPRVFFFFYYSIAILDLRGFGISAHAPPPQLIAAFHSRRLQKYYSIRILSVALRFSSSSALSGRANLYRAIRDICPPSTPNIFFFFVFVCFPRRRNYFNPVRYFWSY